MDMTGFDWSPLLGRWAVSGRAIEITRSGEEIVALTPGLPEELAPRLVASDPGAPAVIQGGPYHGLTVASAERDGTRHLVLGGTITLQPWDESSPVPPVLSIPAPPTEVDPDTERAYQDLLDQVRVASGAQLSLPAEVSLGPWIQWVTRQQVVLFHGSADGGIEELLPRRTSYEINDEAGRGNRGAVYATHDGCFAMWFAVVDRVRLRGSIRSIVEDFTAADGSPLPVYSFSVDYRELPKQLWRNGWLYLLGRETFEQMPFVPGGPPSPEWCSTEAVRPLARIAVGPTDFPFLHQVGGHDDGDLLRFDDLADVVRNHAVGAWPTERGVVLRVTWAGEVADIAEEYLRLAHKWLPQVRREFRHDADGVTWLHMDASDTSPDMAVMVRNSYQDLIDAT